MGLLSTTAGDVDGDGIAEVVAIRDEKDPKGPYRAELLVLDGRNGQPKWTWSWEMQASDDRAPPLLVDFDGNGRRTVCLLVHEKDHHQIVVFGPGGQVRERIPLKGSPWGGAAGYNHLPWWNGCDVDGDGKEELLFTSDGQLWASRGSAERPLWKWTLPKPESVDYYGRPDLAICEIRPGNNSRPATLVARVRWRTVYGLSGLTGLPLWHCEVEPGPISVLWAGDSADPPRIWTEGKWATVCRQAWPSGPDGQYTQLTPAAMNYEVQPPEEVRPLPWWGYRAEDLLVAPAIGALCLVLVVIPGLLVCWAARRDSCVLGLLAALSGIFGILLCPKNDSEVLHGVSVLVALAVPGQFAYWALRRKSLQLHLLVLTGAAAVLGAFLYSYRPLPGPGPLGEFGVACVCALIMGVATLPVLALVGLLIAYVRRRQWARIGWLLGLSLVLSLAIAALLLALDVRQMEPSEQYSWDGWYTVWALGAYAAGTVALVGLAMRNCWRRFLAWRRGRSGKQLVSLLAALLLLAVVVLMVLAGCLMHPQPG
jgi:hypothetical protein